MHSARCKKKSKGLAQSWPNLKEPASGLLEPPGLVAKFHIGPGVLGMGGGARTWRACTLAPLAQDSLPSLPSSGQEVQTLALEPSSRPNAPLRVYTLAHPGCLTEVS